MMNRLTSCQGVAGRRAGVGSLGADHIIFSGGIGIFEEHNFFQTCLQNSNLVSGFMKKKKLFTEHAREIKYVMISCQEDVMSLTHRSVP